MRKDSKMERLSPVLSALRRPPLPCDLVNHPPSSLYYTLRTGSLGLASSSKTLIPALRSEQCLLPAVLAAHIALHTLAEWLLCSSPSPLLKDSW